MAKLPTDHIWVILAAFLAALGCFTACSLVGVDATSIGTLRDTLLMLGGALAGVSIGKFAVTRAMREGG